MPRIDEQDEEQMDDTVDNMDVEDASSLANNSNTTATNNVGAPQPHEPTNDGAPSAASLNLDNIRATFNSPEGLLRSSRSTSTFNTDQNESTKLILHLFLEKPECLHDDFLRHLHDVDEAIVYDDIQPSRKLKTPPEKRKEQRREQTLRQAIGIAIGPGGVRPPVKTINFDAFLSDPLIYVNYIQTTKVKPNNKLMKPGVYGGYHTCLNNLFRRYRVHPSDEYVDDLNRYMDGVKRIANLANQAGEVSRFVNYLYLITSTTYLI